MKKLKRSRDNRSLAGVCGGIGEYFNIDATIIRVVFGIAALCSLGTMILVYILLVLIIPVDDGMIDV